MKKIILCGLSVILVGTMAFAETIDNKSTQDDAATIILRHNKRSFFMFIDEYGKDITDEVLTKEVLDTIEFTIDNDNKDMELIDKGDYIEIKKKSSPKPR